MTRTLLGALLFSFSGIFIRLADSGAAQSAFYRNVYALPALFALLLIMRHSGGVRDRPLILPVFILTGTIEGGKVIAYHVAVGIIGAGIATLLASLQVLFVGVASALFLSEQPRRGFWVSLPCILVGIALLATSGQVVNAGPSFLFGVSIGVVCGLLYAGFLVMLRVVRNGYPEASSIEIMTSAALGIITVTGLATIFEGVAAPPDSLAANFWILCVALASPVFGWLLVTSSIHLIPSAMTATVLLLQPALAVIWGMALLGEPVSWSQLVGIVFVLTGIAVAHQATVARPEAA